MALILCFLPFFAGLLIFINIFKLKLSHLLLASLLGLVAVIPIEFIQYLLLPSLSFFQMGLIAKSLVTSLIFYGLVEECFKMAFLMPLPHKTYSERDFMLLSFMAGLSVACFESSIYFLMYLQKANINGAEVLYGMLFLRIFSSDLIHMLCTGLCGLFLFSQRQKSTKISILITAILIHGFYDFFAGFNNNLRWFSVAVLLFAMAQCRIKYRLLSSESE